MKFGDLVTPKTSAGLQLADVPVNGDYDQKLNTTCVFKGTGKILKIKYSIIDYNTWPSHTEFNIGKIKYKNCLIKCESGIG